MGKKYNISSQGMIDGIMDAMNEEFDKKIAPKLKEQVLDSVTVKIEDIKVDVDTEKASKKIKTAIEKGTNSKPVEITPDVKIKPKYDMYSDPDKDYQKIKKELDRYYKEYEDGEAGAEKKFVGYYARAKAEGLKIKAEYTEIYDYLMENESKLKSFAQAVSNEYIQRFEELQRLESQMLDLSVNHTEVVPDSSPIANAQEQIRKELKETEIQARATEDAIKEAYDRMANTKDSWTKASISRTLNSDKTAEMESTRQVLSGLKNAHESYDLSVNNQWDWEKQYEWAVKFISFYEEYSSRADGTAKSLAKHTELYNQLKPLVEGYRMDLQAVLDYTPAVNQTPLSSESKTADAVEEAAKEIEVADEKIEASNEEVAKSEEKVEKTTKESRKKSSSAAKEQADATKRANKEIIESNREVVESEKKVGALVGVNNEAPTDKKVFSSNGRDIISQTGLKDEAVGKFSFVERLQDGQLQTVLVKYDQSTKQWYEEVMNLTTAFEQVGKEVISLDNKINQYELNRDKMKQAHPDYDTSADDRLIALAEKRRQVLLDTLGVYNTEKEYAYEMAAFEQRRIDNQERLKAESSKQGNILDVKSLELAQNEAKKVNDELNKTSKTFNSLSKPVELTQHFSELKQNISNLDSQLASGKISVSEHSQEVSKLTSEYSDLVKIQQKRDLESYKQFEVATKQNNDAANAYDGLIAKAKDYYSLLAKENYYNQNPSMGKLDIIDSNRLKELKQEFEDAAQGIGVFSKALLGSQDSLDKYDEAQSRYLQNSKQAYVDYLVTDVAKSSEKFDISKANKRALQYVEKYNNAVNDLEKRIEDLKNKAQQGINIVTDDELAEIAKLQAEIKNLQHQLRVMHNNKEYEVADEEIAYRQMAKISQILEKNTKMSRSMKEQFKALQQDYDIVIKTGGSQKRLEELNAELSKLNANLQASGRTGNSFFNLVGKKINGMAAEFFATYLSLQDLLQLARQGFETIKEYDTALTEMNKVSKESLSTLKEFQQESFALADAIGATASAVQNSTADWLRLGESLQEAAESAQATNILFNVSEFSSIDEATDSLVSMSQAYKDLEKMDIVDIMNNIGNNYAISTDGLASALQNSASALTTAGNDINEAVALITAGNAVVQDPNSVGAGLRTISLRLVGTKEAKAELEALGEDTEGLITTTSKLRDTILSATRAASEDGKGFDILDENGNYKSTYEIMLGLADLYDDIVAKDKELGTNNLNLLLETIAGKNRSNIAASILQNSELLESVYDSSLDSEGSALRENEAYLESIQGHLNQLKNTWDSLWVGENNREVINFFLDFAKGALEALDAVGGLKTALIGGGGLFAGIKMFKSGGRAKSCPSSKYATGEFSSDVYELRVA